MRGPLPENCSALCRPGERERSGGLEVDRTDRAGAESDLGGPEHLSWVVTEGGLDMGQQPAGRRRPAGGYEVRSLPNQCSAYMSSLCGAVSA